MEETPIYGRIYKLTDKTNGKIYIGQGKQSLALILSHLKSKAKKSEKYGGVYEAIRENGIENFTLEEIVSASSSEELDNLQRHWIIFYDSRNPEIGYNSSKGSKLWKGHYCGSKTRSPDGTQDKEYRRSNYLANKERVLLQQKEYRLRNPERVKEQKREFHQRHKEKLNQKAREYRAAHLEEVREKSRERSRKTYEERKPYMKEYIEKNKDKLEAQRKERYVENREVYKQECRDRALNKWLKLAKWTKEKYEEEKNKGCGICGGDDKIVFDHDHDSGEFRGLLCCRCNRFLDWALKFQPQISQYNIEFKEKLAKMPICERVNKEPKV